MAAFFYALNSKYRLFFIFTSLDKTPVHNKPALQFYFVLYFSSAGQLSNEFIAPLEDDELEIPDLPTSELDDLPAPKKGLLVQYASVNKKKKRKNVLIVEDNKIYREMIANILSTNNYAVDQADDGSIALSKIKEKPYDCIIMDLFMPNLDGFNTTKKIKQIQSKKDVPIIALTGNKKKALLKKWAEVGINAYLVKPSNKEEILAAVGKYT